LHERAESWRLSPAFDMNPNPAPGAKELSTAVDFDDFQASIDNLVGVAEYFRLDAREAADVLAQVASTVGHWRTTATSHGLTQAEIEQMEPAFEHAEREQADFIVRGHRS
jgi:serine/threonine-protein kinase HipA